MSKDPKPLTTRHSVEGLLGTLRELITEARQHALRAVDVVQVRTCWEVGRHIVEFEQCGATRAEYGARLLPQIAERLTVEFGKGFDESNLRYMRLFYQAFLNRDALRHELSWTHYRLLLRVEDTAARKWYMNEAAGQNWGTRALERQIGTLYYERLLASKDRRPVRTEAAAKVAAVGESPREFLHDPVMLEFLGMPETGQLLESRLEDALLNNLQGFLLELGKGFAFVARRLQKALDWIDVHRGKPANMLRKYHKEFSIDWECAIAELQTLGVRFEQEYLKQLRITIAHQFSDEKKHEPCSRHEFVSCTGGDTDSNDTFAYIAGYTSNGVPYGVTWEEWEQIGDVEHSIQVEP